MECILDLLIRGVIMGLVNYFYMYCLGIRCSSNYYTFVVVQGSKQGAVITDSGITKCPNGYSPADRLNWLLQEFEALIKENNISAIAIKETEPMARNGSNNFCIRVENEAMVFLASVNCDIKSISKKAKQRIAKDFGLKGKSKYLQKLDMSLLKGYTDLNQKLQEAALVAWSSLPSS